MRQWLRCALVAAGVLVAIVAGILWFFSANLRRFHTAQVATAKTDMLGILGALEDWSIHHDGAYPDSLEALLTPDENGDRYLDTFDVPVDPWGREYLYLRGASPEPSFVLVSFGSDGIQGGSGERSDLLLWDVQAWRR